MTTTELLNLSLKDINRMSDKELRQATSIVRSTARKRYERLVDAEEYSPAVESIRRSSAGKSAIFPTVKGMDRTQLLNEFKRQKQFLSMKTSTVSGAKLSKQNVKRETESIVGRKLTDSEVVDVWRVVGELTDGEFGGIMNYKQVAETVSEIIQERPSISDTDLKSETRKRLREIYEREQTAGAIYTSQFM